MNTEIAERLERFLVEGLPTRRVLLENVEGVLAKPYLTFEVVPVASRNATVGATASATVDVGKIFVSVVAELGLFARPARLIADEVIALFPYGLRINLTSGSVLVTKPPEMLQGYRDGPEWRQPIVIDWKTEL